MNAQLTTSLHAPPTLIRRMRFVPRAQPSELVLRKFTHPQPFFAVCDTCAPNATAESPGPDGNDEFLFALFPANPTTLPDQCRDAQQWLNASQNGRDGMVEVDLRDDRVFWKAGRAAFLGSPERADEALTPLIEFAFVEGQIRRLEAEVDAAWMMARGDIPLTHQVAPRDVARWPEINKRTCRVTLCRMDHCDLQRQLESPLAELSVTARQILVDLCGRARLADRLGAMEARIIAMMSLYGAANDRLSAYSYFRREWWLEVWIILVIIAEMAAIFVQLWMA
jgi:hypothetical protein